jgi:hypothetical protein
MSEDTKIVKSDNTLTKWNGRNSKLSQEFVQALEKVLFDKYSILLNQEEIITEANELLPNDKRIGYRTFMDWKAKGFDLKGVDEQTQSAFSQLLKKIKRVRKQAVAKGMIEAKGNQWMKWGWIGERIDDDLNLTKKVDHTTDGKEISNFKFIYPTDTTNAEDAEIINDK